ncbi:hypothetical protein PIB30_104018, partial [Stylosanthes scabra]|nr:hypothetical protein [Stylosanthes scabra]
MVYTFGAHVWESEGCSRLAKQGKAKRDLGELTFRRDLPNVTWDDAKRDQVPATQ